jgi:hypothetical protein
MPIVDDAGDGCNEGAYPYNTNQQYCGGYDTTMFFSGQMCCGCGGGEYSEVLECGGNGTCDAATGDCSCAPNYSGDDCTVLDGPGCTDPNACNYD